MMSDIKIPINLTGDFGGGSNVSQGNDEDSNVTRIDPKDASLDNTTMPPNSNSDSADLVNNLNEIEAEINELEAGLAEDGLVSPQKNEFQSCLELYAMNLQNEGFSEDIINNLIERLEEKFENGEIVLAELEQDRDHTSVSKGAT